MLPGEHFTETAEKYMDTIFRIAFNYLKSQTEADDVTQEVLLKLYKMELPRKYRVAIYLYYYEGYHTEEIAGILHIPKATVATHLHRGRELLKRKLTEVNDHV